MFFRFCCWFSNCLFFHVICYCTVTAVFYQAKSSIRFHILNYCAAPYLYSDLISGLGEVCLFRRLSRACLGGVWFHLIKLFCALQLDGWKRGGFETCCTSIRDCMAGGTRLALSLSIQWAGQLQHLFSHYIV